MRISEQHHIWAMRPSTTGTEACMRIDTRRNRPIVNENVRWRTRLKQRPRLTLHRGTGRLTGTGRLQPIANKARLPGILAAPSPRRPRRNGFPSRRRAPGLALALSRATPSLWALSSEGRDSPRFPSTPLPISRPLRHTISRRTSASCRPRPAPFRPPRPPAHPRSFTPRRRMTSDAKEVMNSWRIVTFLGWD